MPIRAAKSTRDAKAPDDGLRLLVMRFWPRGVAKAKVDLYLPDLAPSAELVHAFKGGRLKWPDFARRYRREMTAQTSLLRLLKHLHGQGETITLLCACPDPARCHRSLLKDLIERSR
jgi:uncharacterized protein YeaO (DUF488 family)